MVDRFCGLNKWCITKPVLPRADRNKLGSYGFSSLPAVCCEAESHPSQNSQLNFYPWIFSYPFVFMLQFQAAYLGKLVKGLVWGASLVLFQGHCPFLHGKQHESSSATVLLPRFLAFVFLVIYKGFSDVIVSFDHTFFLTQSFNCFGIREDKNWIKVFANFLPYFWLSAKWAYYMYIIGFIELRCKYLINTGVGGKKI